MLPIVAALGALGPACGPTDATRPNVLLIVVDTLRWDRVGSYGSKRDTTPSIDRLASDAIRFERAYATAPWTMPSVASMITGHFPSSHGVVHLKNILSDESLTLAERLQNAGYRTCGIVSHLMLGSEFNFDQGFDQFVQLAPWPDPHQAITSYEVTRNAEMFLRGLGGDQPFLLFVHYFDPHYVYQPHPMVGYAAPSAGRLKGGESIHELRSMLKEATPEEIEFVEDVYDEEVRYTDDGIGRLLETLKELDLYDATLVVVVSDHGEEFLSHGWLGHARTLYDELVRVPLILRIPGHRGGAQVVETPVSLASLTPTIVELVGLDPAGAGFQASSLVPLLTGGPSPGDGIAYSEVDLNVFAAHKRAIATRRFKLIRDDVSGKIELYDLTRDPHERQDVADRLPDVVESLLRELERRIALAPPGLVTPGERSFSEDDLMGLRRLGYIE